MEGVKTEKGFQAIDIREIVRGRNQKVARRTPGFVYRWLERILHLREINEFMAKYGHLEGLPFTDEIIRMVNISYETRGLENIPKDGRFMFVSNHPLGGLDGVLLLKLLNENFGNTRVISNDFLMAIGPLSKWFVPINKIGGQARESIKIVESLYKSDDQVLIFPAGLCSRKIKGTITDLPWQKHFVQKAIENKLDIIPIHFEGRNTNRFYNLANLRKALNIKFNIEMMFLVDELFKHRNKSFKIHIGKPIPYTSFDKSKRPIDWAAHIKELSYNLKKK